MEEFQHINWEGIEARNKKLIMDYAKHRHDTMNKSIPTVRSHSAILRELSKFLKQKSLKEVNEKDVQDFLNRYKNQTSRDLYATALILFYRNILKLKRRERPPFLEYYDYQKEHQKQKNNDPERKEKYFITREEYDTIITKSNNLQDKALWETLYLSGARCGEISSMNIEHFKTLPNGYEIIVVDSKTQPRHIPLTEHPEHLIRWIANHDNKDQPESPMWIGRSNRKLNQRLDTAGIDYKFRKILQKTEIKKSLTPHCYRRTRATLMFPEYTDKEMSIHFGWRVNAVPDRRAEYDLTDYKDLKNKVFNHTTMPPSYDQIKTEKESLESELTLIKTQIAEQNKRIQELFHNEVKARTQQPGDHIDQKTPKNLGKGKKLQTIIDKNKELKN